MIPTLVSPIRGKALMALALFVVPVCAVAQTTFTPPAVASVPNPCPRFTAGSTVANPVALYSSHGILAVNFSYQSRMDDAGRTLYCFMTPSGL
jgi:hypothetical protein